MSAAKPPSYLGNLCSGAATDELVDGPGADDDPVKPRTEGKPITVCGSPIRRPDSFGRYARALPVGYPALSGYDCRSADDSVPSRYETF